METHSGGNPEERTVERGRQNPRWRPAAAAAIAKKQNNRNILLQKCESRSFTSITTTPRQAARVTHQSQHQTGEQRDQAEDDIRAPNRNAKLVRHVVVATLENTRGAIKGGRIKRQTECVKRLILWWSFNQILALIHYLICREFTRRGHPDSPGWTWRVWTMPTLNSFCGTTKRTAVRN